MNILTAPIAALAVAAGMASCVPARADTQSLCTTMSDVAFNTMVRRQGGYPYMEEVRLANEPQYSNIRAQVMTIVNAAHASPVPSSAKLRQEQAITFGIQTYAKCLRAWR